MVIIFLTSVSGLPDLFFLTVGYFLSSRPSSALLDEQQKAANSEQAGSESQEATTLLGSSGFQALHEILHQLS
jgi:hypothetical protein